MADRPEILGDRGKSLEDEFFRRQDQQLVQKLKELQALEVSREALARASGIQNEAVLRKLVDLGVHAETVAALSLVPLVEVAWADGSLDAREKAAVLQGAAAAGLTAGTPAHEILQRWLESRPEPRLLTAWTHMVQGLIESMGPAEAAGLQSGLLDRARAVATASGGFLGLGSRISGAEERMLQDLAAAFTRR
jgi:hypothetical protein